MATRFRLSLGTHQIELAQGTTVLGRSDECTICLDDERVSRTHAQVEIKGDRALLSDLGSRNGTLLNGRPIREPTAINDGDVIRIGRNDLKVHVQKLKRARSSADSRSVTLHGAKAVSAPTHATLESFDLSSELTAEADLVRKALQMGRFDEAERLLKARVIRLVSQNTEASPGDPGVQITTEGLLRLAQNSMDAVWLDRLFMLHANLGWWMEIPVENQAMRLLRAIGKLGGRGIREYLTVWTARLSELDADRRRRIQQLRELADHLTPKEEP